MGSSSSSKITFVNSNNTDSSLHHRKFSGLLYNNNNNNKSLFVCRNFSESYDLGKEIGVGSFASVNKCFRKSDLAEFAVKIINKRYLTDKELIGLRDEISILKKIHFHSNIIQLIDVFDDGKNVYMVLELCDNKDLFDEIVSSKSNHFTESKSSQIIYTLSNALKYLHENKIVHRDLKPENILFGKDGNIKITDFGLAHYDLNNNNNNNDNDSDSSSSSFDLMYMNTCCGTPHYVAPEIITKNEYNYKCDMWSLGVILYIMLVGYQPFNANSLNAIYKLIAKGKYNFNSRRWNNISDDAKDLVKKLLQIDPKKRYDSNDIKYHPFIIKHNNLSNV